MSSRNNKSNIYPINKIDKIMKENNINNKIKNNIITMKLNQMKGSKNNPKNTTKMKNIH
jgi:hypothetical protein